MIPPTTNEALEANLAQNNAEMQDQQTRHETQVQEMQDQQTLHETQVQEINIPPNKYQNENKRWGTRKFPKSHYTDWQDSLTREKKSTSLVNEIL